MPGGSHDSYAWQADDLCARMRNTTSLTARELIRRGLHLIGDDAYPSCHTMAVPWPGRHHAESAELAYNFVHSSIRMSVERAFGMLCRKFLLLKRALERSLRRTWHAPGIMQTVSVCMLLHNVCVRCPM